MYLHFQMNFFVNRTIWLKTEEDFSFVALNKILDKLKVEFILAGKRKFEISLHRFFTT